MDDTLSRLTTVLETHGLMLRGAFHPAPSDAVPSLADGSAAGTLVMVGNVGSTMFEHLARSPEYGTPADPLDRWTRRTMGAVADEVGALALFPFDGPPFLPFQTWAMRADSLLHRSPIGLLIHPVYGLWHALRAALLFGARLDLPEVAASDSPCDSCAGRPCLTTCPVGAFTAEGYAVDKCRGLLGTLSGQNCMMLGCQARRACPVGKPAAYRPAHAAFHMRAFRSAPR